MDSLVNLQMNTLTLSQEPCDLVVLPNSTVLALIILKNKLKIWQII